MCTQLTWSCLIQTYLFSTALDPVTMDFSSEGITDYYTWIEKWHNHLEGAPTSIKVPAQASLIHTPLIIHSWRKALSSHPNQPLVEFFLKGISQGFRIGFNHLPNELKPARKNLAGALQHPQVVEEYLSAELLHHRVAGPFTKDLSFVHINRFGVIPKHHQPNKWRLIVDLSYPDHHSVNAGIPKSLCGLSYITIDNAIQKILELGPNTLLAKIDIKNAFRLLPVHPADRHLLGMEWNKRVYIDTCLPFGLRSAPKLFNTLADLLAWIAEQRGVSLSLHYLDDFLTIGPASSTLCQENLSTFQEVCRELGIPLAVEKVEGPSTSLTFLGIVLDTAHMEIRLPDEKLQRIQKDLVSWLGRKKATKKEILSLVGLLQHATKVVRCGRTFVSRMYWTAARVRELSFFVRLNRDFRSDVYWWHTFLNNWNGLSFLRHMSTVHPPDHRIQTDASGGWGCGAFFEGRWLQCPWSSDWLPCNIMTKELVPIILSCGVWGPVLARRRILFQCDNYSVVTAVNKGSSKDPLAMHLLRCLWLFLALYDIDIITEHIAGATNQVADMLSRNRTDLFLSQHPQVSRVPTPLPPSLLLIVSPHKMDWTSRSFRQCFKDTISTV